MNLFLSEIMTSVYELYVWDKSSVLEASKANGNI